MLLTSPNLQISLGPAPSGPTGAVFAVAFSPDGHTLASGGFHGTSGYGAFPQIDLDRWQRVVLEMTFAPMATRWPAPMPRRHGPAVERHRPGPPPTCSARP